MIQWGVRAADCEGVVIVRSAVDAYGLASEGWIVVCRDVCEARVSEWRLPESSGAPDGD